MDAFQGATSSHESCDAESQLGFYVSRLAVRVFIFAVACGLVQ